MKRPEVNAVQPVELAQALYALSARIATQLQPGGEQRPWDMLGLEEQTPFLRVAGRGPDLLIASEGARVCDAARDLFRLSRSPDEDVAAVWDHLSEPVRLFWEAQVRLIYTLLDCDERHSVEDAVQLFANWYAQKAATLLQGVAS